jgi:hypothetical protein
LWKRKLIFSWVLLTTVGIVLCSYLLVPPLDDWCTGVGYLPSNRAITNVHALKVVIEPMLGRHQVYGIFQLEREKCPPNQAVVLTVSGAGKYCETAGVDQLQNFEGIEPLPGYYLSKHYIRSRTALWLSIRGQLDQLRQPRNWTLTYAITG